MASHDSGLHIIDLPSEILCQVFEDVCSDKSDNKSYLLPVVLSQVSRRFRTIALDMPAIWAQMHGDWPIERVRIFLERSRDFNLYVSWNNPNLFIDPIPIGLEFFKMLLPHSQRWSALHIAPYVVAPILSDINLTNLTDLDLSLYGNYLETPNLVRKWAMPSLLHLRCSDVLPLIGWFKSLKTFEFKTTKFSATASTIAYLSHALIHSPNLETLQIELYSDNSIVLPRPDSVQEPLTSMPRLRNISIHVRLGRSPLWIPTFFSHIDVPNLDELNLKLHFIKIAHVHGGDVMFMQLDSRPVHPAVLAPETLKISLSCERAVFDDCGNYECDRAFEYWTDSRIISTHRLKSLRIEGRHLCLKPPIVNLAAFIPLNIHSLSFVDCDNQTLETVLSFVHHLRKSSRLDGERSDTVPHVEILNYATQDSDGDIGREIELRAELGDRFSMTHRRGHRQVDAGW